MIRSFLMTLAALTALSPRPAEAGPWLREKGSGFTALTFGATQFSETTNALYFEYGLTENTTVGLDVSAFTNSLNVRNGFGNLFLRRAIGPTDGPMRMAYEVGLGGLWGNERQLPTLTTGVSWGHGFEMTGRPGWISATGSFVYEPTLGQHITRLDGTLGLDFGKVVTGLVETTLSYQNDDSFGAVEPAVLIRPADSAFRIRIGAQIPFSEQQKTALKLGIWHSF